MNTPSAPILISFPSKQGLTNALSAFVSKASADSIAKRGRFTVAISGGNVPKLLAGLINDPAVQWDKWFVGHSNSVPLSTDIAAILAQT